MRPFITKGHFQYLQISVESDIKRKESNFSSPFTMAESPRNFYAKIYSKLKASRMPP